MIYIYTFQRTLVDLCPKTLIALYLLQPFPPRLTDAVVASRNIYL
jgi:hypothetical protein